MTQIISSGVISFLIAIFLTPVLIRRFSEEGLGQEIREDGPQSHLRKRGTPTMGGIAIIAGIVGAYVIVDAVAALTGHAGFSVSGLLVLGLTLALGGLGFADDYIKLAKARNLGLNKKAKLIGQLGAALLFGVLAINFPDSAELTTASTHLSFVRDIDTINLAVGGGIIGTLVFLVFIYILVSAWSNAVNLTDGLDGLAAGTTAMVMGAFTLITFWQFHNSCERAIGPGCYQVRDPQDLAVLTAAGLGACLGFLWWNAAPAKIFMGDTGSLALGGLVAGVSVASRTELLMVIIGSLFVIEVASVAIQIAVFKTKGTRFFRMAPLHHHFENGGWAEITVVVRFWMLTALACLIGLSLFFAEWIRTAGV